MGPESEKDDLDLEKNRFGTEPGGGKEQESEWFIL